MKKPVATPKVFLVRTMATNFLNSHKSHYYEVKEESGKFVVIPRSK